MDLNQVTVPTTDLGRARSFYERLGLELVVESDEYLRFECPDGDSTFSVDLVEHLAPSGVVIYFECADLDERVEALQRAGIEFTTPPTDERWLWREARLSDPDGHRLCLYYAGPNRTHPPWRIEP